jgi:hypothetical protein
VDPVETSDAASIKADFDTPKAISNRTSKKKKKQQPVNFMTDSDTQSL